MKHWNTSGIGAVLSASLLLAACGGGGSSGTGTTTVGGTAATGAAMTSGTVELSCGSGVTRSATISGTGTWSTTVPTANLPCAVKASDGTNTYFSFTVGNGSSIVTNVTPLTSLALAQILGTDPATLFATLSATDLAKLNSTAINAAISALNTVLANYALPAGFNPVTTPLVAAAPGQAGNHYDGLLDQFAAANPSLSTLITAAATGTMPTMGTPSYAAAATSLNDFLTKFAGDYTLKVSSSGAEGTNNSAVRALLPIDSAVTVHIKANGDVKIDAVGRTIDYLASTYAGNTTGSVVMARTDFMPSDLGRNVLRYRSANGSFLDLYVSYDPSNGQLQVDPQGFVNTEGYASLRGVIVQPPAALPPASCTGTTLTFAGTAAGLYTDGQEVCFTTITQSSLAFASKSLSSPVQNTAVSAPYSAWKFTDGSYVYEVIFNGSALHEINLNNGPTFLGQFAADEAPAVTPVAISALAPSSGAVGSQVTITGSGFSTTAINNVVRFATNVAGPAPQATVVSASATQLVVTVPAGAMTGGVSVYNTVSESTAWSSDFIVTSAGSGGGSSTLGATISARFAGTYTLSCYSNGSGSALVTRTVVVNADGTSTLDGNAVIATDHGGLITYNGGWGSTSNYSIYSAQHSELVTDNGTRFKLRFDADGNLVTNSNRSHEAYINSVGGTCTGISGSTMGAPLSKIELPALIGSYALTDTVSCPNVTNMPSGSTVTKIDSDGTLRLGDLSLAPAQYAIDDKSFSIIDAVSFPPPATSIMSWPSSLEFRVNGDVFGGSQGAKQGAFNIVFDKDKRVTRASLDMQSPYGSSFCNPLP